MRHGKISTRPNARWPGFARLLLMLTVANIMITVPCLSGCASYRKSVTEHREQSSDTIRIDSVIRIAQDSVIELIEVKKEAVKVPRSEVSLTIAIDSLRRLPAGAVYSERSGQASVKVTRKSATGTEPEYIYVYATCDSLLLQCEYYERTIRNLHRNYNEQVLYMEAKLAESEQVVKELKEKPPNGIGIALKWLLIGLFSGIIGTIIIFEKIGK